MENIKDELKNWKEMIGFIPKMQEAVKIGYDRHLAQMNIKHGKKPTFFSSNEHKGEIDILKRAFRIFQGKYTLEIICIVSAMKKPYFNQIKSALSNINPGTLTKRLKFLKSQGILERQVHVEQQVRVSYQLTELGWGFFYLLFPVLLYYSFQDEFSKDFKINS